MNTPKIISVQALEKSNLSIRFENGIIKEYDCKQLFHLERFSLLRNNDLFKTVRVDVGGYGITWNDMIDLSEYELWTNGTEVGSTILE